MAAYKGEQPDESWELVTCTGLTSAEKRAHEKEYMVIAVDSICSECRLSNT